jgi:hypothetical protein
MRKFIIILLLFAAACSFEKKTEQKPTGPLVGNWAFLDVRGNYNEAFFTDTTYVTYNMAYGLSPVFRYFIKNDSLYSNIDKRKKGLNRIAGIKLISPDSIILTTEFSKDTIGRMAGEKITLETTNPKTDSVLFHEEIQKRYESFLLSKGILKKEELEMYKKDKIIPEDVKNNQGR